MPALPPRPAVALAAALLALSPAALAQRRPAPARPAAATRPAATQEIHYDVRWPNPVQHETRVTVTFPGLVRGRPLDVLMPRASPGRYALHEFAKNVYDVSATDGAGRALAVVRAEPSRWAVAGHDGTVRFSYTLYANHPDGTYAGVDSTHAHYNMPAAFVYGRGLDARPVRITFHPVNGWRIATQLFPTADPHTFTAPDLAYFMDSPTELSAFTLLEWRTGPNGATRYRIALHHTGTQAEADAYAAMAARVVEEAAAVFGEHPAFDGGTYTFLADYLPWAKGDGMEHRNSTIISSTGALRDGGDLRLLGTLAHEHFHAWNMERLRDDALEPFDFQQANSSENLWFGEGFTSYYDGLVRVRAGYLPLATYAAEMAGNLNAVIGSPARATRGPAEMSRMAPFVDAAASIDETSYPNTFVSYYTWGEALGFGLDLLLRARYNTTLDAYMRAMWQAYGRHQRATAPARPYDRAALQRVLGEVTGDAAFAADFFRRHVERGDVLDYAALVAPAGLVLRPARPDRGTLGALPLAADTAGARVTRVVPPGSAAARAGIASGDRLLTVEGVRAVSAQAIDGALAGKRPGDVVTVVYEQRGATRTARVALAADEALELVTFEHAGRPVTDAVRVFRQAWLGAKADG